MYTLLNLELVLFTMAQNQWQIQRAPSWAVSPIGWIYYLLIKFHAIKNLALIPKCSSLLKDTTITTVWLFTMGVKYWWHTRIMKFFFVLWIFPKTRLRLSAKALTPDPSPREEYTAPWTCTQYHAPITRLPFTNAGSATAQDELAWVCRWTMEEYSGNKWLWEGGNWWRYFDSSSCCTNPPSRK